LHATESPLSLTTLSQTEVRDLLLRPPAERPYDVLKDQLTTEELGNHKPTQLLHRMQQLLGDRPGATDGLFLQELFLQRLLPNMVHASSPDTTSLDKLAEMADKIMEVATHSSTVAAINSPHTLQHNGITTDTDSLQPSFRPKPPHNRYLGLLSRFPS
jgi:hypothetical protein